VRDFEQFLRSNITVEIINVVCDQWCISKTLIPLRFKCSSKFLKVIEGHRQWHSLTRHRSPMVLTSYQCSITVSRYRFWKYRDILANFSHPIYIKRSWWRWLVEISPECLVWILLWLRENQEGKSLIICLAVSTLITNVRPTEYRQIDGENYDSIFTALAHNTALQESIHARMRCALHCSWIN